MHQKKLGVKDIKRNIKKIYIKKQNKTWTATSQEQTQQYQNANGT